LDGFHFELQDVDGLVATVLQENDESGVVEVEELQLKNYSRNG